MDRWHTAPARGAAVAGQPGGLATLNFLSGKFTAFIAHPVMPAMVYTGREVVSL